MCCNVLQCVAVRCSVLQCVAVCCSVLQCAAVSCSVLQYVALCCSVLQCAAVCCSLLRQHSRTNQVSHSRRGDWGGIPGCRGSITSGSPSRSIYLCVVTHGTHHANHYRPLLSAPPRVRLRNRGGKPRGGEGGVGGAGHMWVALWWCAGGGVRGVACDGREGRGRLE